jgi:hypothetical protein
MSDLNAKLDSATHSLLGNSSGLQLKGGPAGSQGKGKGKKAEYAGVEDEESSLSKAAKDR